MKVEQYTQLYEETSVILWLYNENKGIGEHDNRIDQRWEKRGRSRPQS